MHYQVLVWKLLNMFTIKIPDTFYGGVVSELKMRPKVMPVVLMHIEQGCSGAMKHKEVREWPTCAFRFFVNLRLARKRVRNFLVI